MSVLSSCDILSSRPRQRQHHIRLLIVTEATRRLLAGFGFRFGFSRRKHRTLHRSHVQQRRRQSLIDRRLRHVLLRLLLLLRFLRATQSRTVLLRSARAPGGMMPPPGAVVLDVAHDVADGATEFANAPRAAQAAHERVTRVA